MKAIEKKQRFCSVTETRTLHVLIIGIDRCASALLFQDSSKCLKIGKFVSEMLQNEFTPQQKQNVFYNQINAQAVEGTRFLGKTQSFVCEFTSKCSSFCLRIDFFLLSCTPECSSTCARFFHLAVFTFSHTILSPSSMRTFPSSSSSQTCTRFQLLLALVEYHRSCNIVKMEKSSTKKTAVFHQEGGLDLTFAAARVRLFRDLSKNYTVRTLEIRHEAAKAL